MEVISDRLLSRFETAYNRAANAYNYNRRGYINQALQEWQKIFGGAFPA